MADTRVKQAMGTKATISIEATDGGELLVGVDLCGEKIGENPTLVQSVALMTAEIIRESVREACRLEGKEVPIRPTDPAD